jgi:hypothetical protein
MLASRPPLSSHVDRCYRSDAFPVSRNPLGAPPVAKGPIPRSSTHRGRSPCSGLPVTPLAQPPGRTWRQRLPARYGARALPRLHVVRDAGKQPAQLDRGRQLALLLECSADCSGFRFGHDEHAGSMVTRAVTGKLLDISPALPVLQHRVDTAPQPPEFLGEPARDRRTDASMSSCRTSPRRKSVQTHLGRPSPGWGAARSWRGCAATDGDPSDPRTKSADPGMASTARRGRPTSGTEVGTRL